jgi:hypothetical protein
MAEYLIGKSYTDSSIHQRGVDIVWFELKEKYTGLETEKYACVNPNNFDIINRKNCIKRLFLVMAATLAQLSSKGIVLY